ncbi:MAG: Type pantothenate kinase [Candidatus Hydrogenedentes bacterium]|nr:Type pantothenate kinase [Candidatus Hydrogenedentota bacterium]
MLLVMDVGNSQTVLGLFEANKLRAHWRVTTAHYRTSDELRILLTVLLQQEGVGVGDIRGCCISSVVPQLNMALQSVSEEAFGVTAVMVGPGIKTGLVLQCENPKEVGADRIVNAVAAIEEHDGALIILDFGTATTFDAVTAKAEWRGGVIVPGVQLSASALAERCAQLPSIDIVKPPTVIGRNTIMNFRSGLTYGYADMVDGLVRRMTEEMACDVTVIATGGLAPVIAQVATTIDHVDPFLTLKGLNTVYCKNERDPA